MKLFARPTLRIQEVEAFFLNTELLASQAKFRTRQKRYSAAALWYLNQGMISVYDHPLKQVNIWVKRAILTFFKTVKPRPSSSGCFEYFDKLPVKRRSQLSGVRVVPGAIVRYGAYVESGVILMPSFVNVGAVVGKDSMIDTWATVGSCAQIGSQVHLSGGVGIGGVLEPEQAEPVVIEDGAFIGSRAVLVEGVRVGKQAVIGAGVTLTSSTKIIDVRGSEPIITTKIIPERAVVIPGTSIKKFPAGEFGVPCALIIGTRTESTDLKTSLNKALREYKVTT